MAQVGQVAISSEIPKDLLPFYTGTGLAPGFGSAVLPKGFELFTKGFGDVYGDVIGQGLMGAGQVAPLSPYQQAVGQELATMGTPTQFQYGTDVAQQAAAGLQGLAGLQAQGVAAPDLTTFQLGPARQFTSTEAQAYMSPYQQAVIDAQQRGAIDAARKAQLGTNLAAARQGTYGGARQTILQGEREAGLRSQLGDIQAKGLQEAYLNAQQQFERDRAAQQGAAQQNLAAALGVQTTGAQQALEAQRLNQAAGLQAAQQRQQALTGLGGLASTFGGLGTTEQAADLDRLKVTGAYGDLERGVAQQAMDAQRAALVQQAEFGQTQLGNLSNLLRGIPLSSSTQTTTTPAPSFASQLAGLGLTGLSLYNMLGGGK